MKFTVAKEYQINEVFKHEQTGKMLMCVPGSFICGGCVGDDYDDCGSNFCCQRGRKEDVSVIYKEVTGPVEGMLYRVEGKLFKLLNRSHWGLTCACCIKSGLMCSTLDLMVFGKKTTTGWYWGLVEEKEAEAPKAEPKPFKVKSEAFPKLTTEALKKVEGANSDALSFDGSSKTKYPDWCRVGAWVFEVTQNKFHRVTAPDSFDGRPAVKWDDRGDGYIGSCGIQHLRPAHLRPWTKEDGPVCFRLKYKGEFATAFLSAHNTLGWGYALDQDGFSKHVTMEDIAKNGIQLDGSPCGIIKVAE